MSGLTSMTGFGAGRADAEAGQIAVEIRSVNHRFREVKTRLPRELAALEPRILAAISERVARGAIEVAVRLSGVREGASHVRVDERVARQAVGALRTLQARLGIGGDVTVGDLLAVEGVIEVDERPLAPEALVEALDRAVREALDALVAMRAEEGRALRDDLLGRLSQLAATVSAISAETDGLVAAYRDRLTERIGRLLADAPLDPGRLETEVALLADRSDVSEELVRLQSHIEQARGLVAGEASGVGKRLGFLLQEMNRETNTIGSKSQSLVISRHVVEMKAELERIREQIQNVE